MAKPTWRHSLVKATAEHQRATPWVSTRYQPTLQARRGAKGVVDVRVSPALLDRALTILDELLTVMERRGIGVSAAGKETFAVIDDYRYPFSLREQLQQIPDRSGVLEFHGTGLLKFAMGNSSGGRIAYIDRPGCPLERQLDHFVATLSRRGRAAKALEASRERRSRLMALENRLMRARDEALKRERAKEQALLDLAHRYRDVQDVRRLARAVRRTNALGAREWAAWATRVASRLNPATHAMETTNSAGTRNQQR